MPCGVLLLFLQRGGGSYGVEGYWTVRGKGAGGGVGGGRGSRIRFRFARGGYTAGLNVISRTKLPVKEEFFVLLNIRLHSQRVLTRGTYQKCFLAHYCLERERAVGDVYSDTLSWRVCRADVQPAKYVACCGATDMVYSFRLAFLP